MRPVSHEPTVAAHGDGGERTEPDLDAIAADLAEVEATLGRLDDDPEASAGEVPSPPSV